MTNTCKWPLCVEVGSKRAGEFLYCPTHATAVNHNREFGPLLLVKKGAA